MLSTLPSKNQQRASQGRYDTIDPEAIDMLLRDQHDASICIRFGISGWNVFVREDGLLRVCDPNLQTDPAPVFDKLLLD